MNESRSSEEAFQQPLVLCPLCMKKIAYVCGKYPQQKGRFQVLLTTITSVYVAMARTSLLLLFQSRMSMYSEAVFVYF